MIKQKRQRPILWNVYTGMRTRCENSNSKDYARYGKRGIKCEWKNFNDFINDMLPTYKKGLSLDRIDNDGNYNKDNCRWATKKQQQNNKSDNVILKYKNKEQTISQWSDELQIKRYVINNRLLRGWSIEIALTKQPRKYRD